MTEAVPQADPVRDTASPRAEARVDGNAGVAARWRVALANRHHRGLARAPADLREAHRDQFLDKRLRQGAVNREVQGALGHRVAVELTRELREDRAAERQVAQVILERGKAGDRLTAYPESRHAVGDHFFRIPDDLEDPAPQGLKRAAARLLNTTQILVDLAGHPVQMIGRGNARVEREAALMKRLAQGRNRSRSEARR